MGFDPGLIDWDAGIRLLELGSGSGDRDLGVRGPGFGLLDSAEMIWGWVWIWD